MLRCPVLIFDNIHFAKDTTITLYSFNQSINIFLKDCNPFSNTASNRYHFYFLIVISIEGQSSNN